MDSVLDILDKIAPQHQNVFIQRHSYIIIGKGGSGSSTLATKLASLTRNELINHDTALQRLIGEPVLSEPNKVTFKFIQILSDLREGNAILPELILDEMKLQISSIAAKRQGFILDGLPLNVSNPSIREQVEYLTEIALTVKNCILIDLRISNQDLIRRRAGEWFDPVTNIKYPGQQVLYSRQRRHEGWVEGEVDLIYVKERARPSQAALIAEETVSEVGDGSEDDKIAVIATPVDLTPKIFSNQKAYPILSEVIMERIIKDPSNDPLEVAKELKLYENSIGLIERFIRTAFNVLQIIELEGSQHPEVLFDQLKAKMEACRFSVCDPLCQPLKVEPLEGAMKGFCV